MENKIQHQDHPYKRKRKRIPHNDKVYSTSELHQKGNLENSAKEDDSRHPGM